MAQDMVASVTLMLRDQMGAGIDEIKAQLAGLKPTLDNLTGVIAELDATLQKLKLPATFNSSLRTATGDAEATAKAVASIGDAASAADAKLKALAIPAMPGMGGAGGIYNPAIPDEFKGPMQVPGVVPVGGEAGPRGRIGGAAEGGGEFRSPMDMMTAINDFIAAALGYEMIKGYGDFNGVLRQIAITEKLKGDAATREAHVLNKSLTALSIRTGQSAPALADAYLRMVTTHMSPGLINQIMPDVAEIASAHAVSSYDVADAAFAINDSYKIGPHGMLSALEMLATAAKQAHFSLQNFGVYLKEVGGVMATMGLTGRTNLNMAAAGLETVIKNSTQPNQAAADYRDFLVYLNSPQLQMATERLGFKRRLEASQYLWTKYNIKPVGAWQIEDAAKAHGQNEVSAILDYIHRVTRPMSASDRAKFIRTEFGNQQSAMTVQSIMLHWGQYHGLEKKLGLVTAATGASDFATAMKGANKQIDVFDADLAQLSRLIGKTLLPVLTQITKAATPVIKVLGEKPGQAWDHFLGWNDGVITKNIAKHDAQSAAQHAQALRDNTRAMHNLTNALGFGPIGPNGATVPTAPAGPVLNRP
jgi:TP901 family phage tail tape measure protein